MSEEQQTYQAPSFFTGLFLRKLQLVCAAATATISVLLTVLRYRLIGKQPGGAVGLIVGLYSFMYFLDMNKAQMFPENIFVRDSYFRKFLVIVGAPLFISYGFVVTLTDYQVIVKKFGFAAYQATLMSIGYGFVAISVFGLAMQKMIFYGRRWGYISRSNLVEWVGFLFNVIGNFSHNLLVTISYSAAIHGVLGLAVGVAMSTLTFIISVIVEYQTLLGDKPASRANIEAAQAGEAKEKEMSMPTPPAEPMQASYYYIGFMTITLGALSVSQWVFYNTSFLALMTPFLGFTPLWLTLLSYTLSTMSAYSAFEWQAVQLEKFYQQVIYSPNPRSSFAATASVLETTLQATKSEVTVSGGVSSNKEGSASCWLYCLWTRKPVSRPNQTVPALVGDFKPATAKAS